MRAVNAETTTQVPDIQNKGPLYSLGTTPIKLQKLFWYLGIRIAIFYGTGFLMALSFNIWVLDCPGGLTTSRAYMLIHK